MLGESYTYDIWANLYNVGAVSGYGGCQQGSLSVVALSNNRLSGFSYDNAGNMTTYPGLGSYTYDAENRMLTAGGVTYTYDAEGQRIMKSNGKLYWHGLGGETLMESELSGNVLTELADNNVWTIGYVYLNGQLLAQYSAGTTYFAHQDHLGSTRLLTKLDQSVQDCTDYLPFGELRTDTCGTPGASKPATLKVTSP